MKLEAILFDCDGVLVDSEPITHAVLRDLLAETGWNLSLAECLQHFVGRTVRSQAALIQAQTGRPLTDDWMATFYDRRNRALAEQLQAVEGAHAAVAAAHAHVQRRIACASGADRFKVEMQLAQVGLMDFFAGRIFSGHEMPRSKPAPDVYLAAAAHLGVAAADCLVIEDTPVGVQAGVAAGATVWAYCPQPEGGPGQAGAQALLAAGAARLLGHMGELPGLLAGLAGRPPQA